MAALRREIEDVAAGIGLVDRSFHRRRPEILERQVREGLAQRALCLLNGLIELL
jgi:hypothetical protein